MDENRIFAKCAWRLIPLMIAGYLINFLDRTNLGFAALTMNRDLGFSPSVYGLGSGLFFLSYSVLVVPANLMLHRFGARRWMFVLFVAWGTTASANALIRGPHSFYALRFLLGIAEAGFFSGVIFYLTLWFPKAWLARVNAMFMCAVAGSAIIGGPLASLILQLDGLAGIRGWQWLFILEGVPACIMGFTILKVLPDMPARASWLTGDEKNFIAARLDAEQGLKEQRVGRALCDPRVLLLGMAYAGMNFASYGFGFWLPLLVQSMGFSNAANGFIVALVYVGSVPAMILAARSSDKRGERVWHVAVGALLAAASLLVASVTESASLALVALAAAGIAGLSIYGPFLSLSAQFLSGRAMAGGYALVNTLGNLLGGFAGQYAIGYIREQSGGYSTVLGTIAGALVITAIIVLGVANAIKPRSLPVHALVETA